jgi:dienelactone hydrolase
MKNKRREFFKMAGLTGIGLASLSKISISGYEKMTQPDVSLPPMQYKPLSPLNRFPRMVHEYFVKQVQQIEQTASERRSALHTIDDAESYIIQVRKKIQECFGPWPDKTPLNAKVVGILDRGKYTIEKVIYESRPGFQVTANLYIPKGHKLPLPGVIGACGHDNSGKAGNQFFSCLAQLGYIVLVFDPIGQGERIQCLTEGIKPGHGIGTDEHIYIGNQMFLTGENLSSWFTWDVIRSLDYLISRKEVDSNHIGVTGVSGGGEQTAWICGTDRRITMAAPACFITTFRHNLENEEPADTEQCPPRALKMGLDHSDFIAAMAPKPAILLGQENDFFDVRGTEEAYARLKDLYKLLGAEQKIELLIGPGSHSFPRLSREAMYSFFNKATKVSDINSEPNLTIDKEEELWCTPHGQVGESGSRNIFFFTSRLSAGFRAERGEINCNDLRLAVINTLKLPAYEGVPDFRILRSANNRQYPKKFAGTYAIETEPGILAIAYFLNDNETFSGPPRGFKRAILYISHQSADDEMRNEPFVSELMNSEPESAIFACDVRGIGESQPNTTQKSFLDPYGSDYFYSIHSIMLDYPFASQKTFDVLRVINWLKSYGYDDVHIAAKGWGAIPATFAAVLSETITQATLKNALTSYSDIAEHEEYNWPLQCIIPGVLKAFDLPDCYRFLKTKKLRQIDPWDAKAG